METVPYRLTWLFFIKDVLCFFVDFADLFVCLALAKIQFLDDLLAFVFLTYEIHDDRVVEEQNNQKQMIPVMTTPKRLNVFLNFLLFLPLNA